MFSLALTALSTENDDDFYGHVALAKEGLALVAAKTWNVDQQVRAQELDEGELGEALDEYAPPFCNFSQLIESREWGYYLNEESLGYAIASNDGVVSVPWEGTTAEGVGGIGVDYILFYKDNGELMLFDNRFKTPVWASGDNWSGNQTASVGEDVTDGPVA